MIVIGEWRPCPSKVPKTPPESGFKEWEQKEVGAAGQKAQFAKTTANNNGQRASESGNVSHHETKKKKKKKKKSIFKTLWKSQFFDI